MTTERTYTVNTDRMIPTCFPDDVKLGQLIDVTSMGDLWGRFIDESTGELHDCAVYAKEAGLE